jgi:hypothetical protein
MRYARGCLIKIQSICVLNVRQDSTVSTVTYCGLGSLGIESGWDKIVYTWTGPGAHPASYIVGTGSFPGVKQLGHGIKHPPLFSAEVNGRVEL